jgi:hypothetical protein
MKQARTMKDYNIKVTSNTPSPEAINNFNIELTKLLYSQAVKPASVNVYEPNVRNVVKWVNNTM